MSLARRVAVAGSPSEARTRSWWQSLVSQPWLTIAVVALIFRILIALPAIPHVLRFFIPPDSFEYDQLGWNLAQGHGFSEASSPPFAPDVRRTPIYPLLLAALYLVGHYPASAVAANLLLGVATCVLTVMLGNRIGGPSVGFIAGLLIATDETSAAYSLVLMTETLFTVLVLVSALKLARYLMAGQISDVIVAALCIGVAFLTRPIGLFLPIIVGPAIWWLRRTSARRASLLAAGAVILVGMLFPAGWTARNYFVAGLAQPTSLIAINGYYYRAAPLQARAQGISVNDEQSALSTAPGIQASRTGEENSAELRTMEQRAIQIILSNPVSYAEINALGTARMLGPDRDILARLSAAERMSTTPPSSVAEFITTTTRHGPETTGVVVGVEVAQLVALYSLAVIGILIGWHDESRRAPVALLVMLIFYFLVISGPEAYPRFRVPMMPFVCVLAALGAQACGRYLAARSILAETDPGARREQA